MKRCLLLAYGIFAYLVCIATCLYCFLFFGNLFVARTIDAAPTVALDDAGVVNVALLALFALQHSGMARPTFKRWLTRWIAPATERSTYVLLSSFALIVVMVFWQPMGGIVWVVDSPAAGKLLTGMYAGGWLLMAWATFLIDHFELFGLRQAWAGFCGRARWREPSFTTPSAYRVIRHPIYSAWLVILWAAPLMTVSHLVLSAGLTLYILVGARLEERDLERRLPYYEQYRRKVPMLLPSWRKRLTADD